MGVAPGLDGADHDYCFQSDERAVVMLDGRLLRDGHEACSIRIVDLTSLGFLGKCGMPVAVESWAVLRLGRLEPLEAQVQWTVDEWACLRFRRRQDWSALLAGVAARTGAPEAEPFLPA